MKYKHAEVWLWLELPCIQLCLYNSTLSYYWSLDNGSDSEKSKMSSSAKLSTEVDIVISELKKSQERACRVEVRDEN